MEFNYLNASSSGRYSYHMPMHLIQQMDLSVMQVPSNTGLSNLINIDVTHCNPDLQVPSADELPDSSNNSTKEGIGDFVSVNRLAPGLHIPSMTETRSAHSVRGNYSQHSQHSSQLHSHGCQHVLDINKTSYVSGVLCDSNHQFNNNVNKNSEVSPYLSMPQKTKCKRGTKRKEKTNKRVRFMKQGCSRSCQRKCNQKLSQNTREDLFNEFWNLFDDCKRRDFISWHVVKMPMMTCKEGSRRSFSVDWAFTVQGESFSVCKLFFLDTLDISEEMAYSVIKETTFYSNVKNTIRKKRARIKKSVWFETDVDDYSKKRAIACLKDKPGYMSKKEKITELRPGCTDSCRRNCHAKFTDQERLLIFNSYQNLANIRKQREFIMKHMRRMERKYAKSNKITRRGCSIEWLLPIKGGSIPVCKTFFLHTVGISEHTAYSISLQNELQPVERHRTPRKVQHSSWSFQRNKYLKELIAKGRLKSILKINLKKYESIDTISYVNDDNIKKANKVEYLCENSRLRSLSLDNNQPFLIMPSDISVMDSYLQQTEFQHQCLTDTADVREHYSSSVDVNINLTSSVFEQQMQSNFGNIADNDYISQPPFHTKYVSSYQQGNHVSPTFNVRGKLDPTPASGHDNLLLNNFKNTSGDLLSFTSEKDSKSIKSKRSQFSKQEKLKKGNVKRGTKKKPFTKKLKDGCSDTCRRKCSQKIYQPAREELFEEFWGLQSDVIRREFILSIVSKVAKKSNKNSDSRRGCTIEWTVPYNGELHFVCKKFFLDTFDITENFVKTVHDKIERNAGSMEDMRGKHGKRSAVFVQEENEIEKYIKSAATYRAIRCIRCNRDFPRWCLEKKLPLSQFYKKYAEVRKLLGVKPVCRTSFTTICANKFNISSNSSQENICDECVIASQATIIPSVPAAFS